MRNLFSALGDEPTLATATIAVRSDGKIAFAIGNIYFAFLPSDARILADALVKAANIAEKKEPEE